MQEDVGGIPTTPYAKQTCREAIRLEEQRLYARGDCAGQQHQCPCHGESCDGQTQTSRLRAIGKGMSHRNHTLVYSEREGERNARMHTHTNPVHGRHQQVHKDECTQTGRQTFAFHRRPFRSRGGLCQFHSNPGSEGHKSSTWAYPGSAQSLLARPKIVVWFFFTNALALKNAHRWLLTCTRFMEDGTNSR